MKYVRKFTTAGVITCVVLCTSTVSALPAQNYRGKTGNDVSWPNCDAQPPRSAAFGIVGVTGGLVFRPNPCLFNEAHWFSNLALYMNTGYKKSAAAKFMTFPKACLKNDEACLAYNFGYNAGVYALHYAASQYVHAGAWWLDVETENSWSTNVEYNRASLRGMVDAIRHYELLPNIGFYAYPGQWEKLTGGWKNNMPAWAATGTSDREAATQACRWPSFTGGKIVMAQYILRLDTDLACP